MTKAAERAAARRDEILDAAERVFVDKGYHEAGIADIATLLQIGHGTFYRYFKNKRDIALNVLDRVVERMAAIGLSENPEESDTLEAYQRQTERILTRMLELAESQPALMVFFHQESLAVDSSRFGSVLDVYAAFTARFLQNGVDKGFLRQDLDVECTSEALVALIFEGMRRVVGIADPARRRRWVAAGVELMFRGVHA